MFASQLLRILQTVPVDESYETRLFDRLALKFTMKENQNEISSLSNVFEKKADPSAVKIDEGNDENASWNPFLSDCSEVMNRSFDGNDKEVTDGEKLFDQEEPYCHSSGEKETAGDSETSYTSISQLIESNSLSETDGYADQSVKEVTEVTVCYKDDNIIKDICVDEGSPGRDNTLIQNDKEDHAGAFFSQPLEDDIEDSRVENVSNCVLGEDDGTKEVEVATCLLNGSKSSVENSAEDVTTNVFGSGNEKQMSDEIWSTAEKTKDDISEDESETSSRSSSQESLEEDDHQFSSKDAKIDEVPSVEAILESLAGAFTSDDPKKNVTDCKLQYDSKLDGSAENSHVNVKHDNLEDKSGAILPNRPSNAEKSDDEPKSLASLLHPGIGDSSFASAGQGLITFSGPMVPYSGSISHRSDSSTTSTRSFAFPVLQTDWNSSPVRMAKAERRRFRKHRGWRQGLLCCKF